MTIADHGVALAIVFVTVSGYEMRGFAGRMG
jgi:hypothetical protein